MRMIAGFTAATSGRVTVAGHDMATHNVRGRAPPRLPPRAAAAVRRARRVRVPAVRRPGEGRAPARRSRAELERVTAACRLEAVVQQRDLQALEGLPAAARAGPGAARRATGLLLDEPTAGLDPGQIQETREVIRAFGERSRGAAEHPHPGRGHADLPPRGDHRSRPAARHRFAGRAAAGRGADQPRDAPGDRARRSDAARGARCRSRACGAVDVAGRAGRSRACSRSTVRWTRATGVEAAIARAVAARWDLHRLERQQPTLENVFLRYVHGAAGRGEAA